MIRRLRILYRARSRKDQPPTVSDGQFRDYLNYVIGAYDKPALAFHYLGHYLGQEKMDTLIQSFYQDWQFKHPQPQDLQQHLERGTGKSLRWLFQDLIQKNTHQDYRIKELKETRSEYRILVENKGDISGPFPVQTYRNGRLSNTQWVEGVRKEKWVQIRKTSSTDRIAIDGEHYTFDINRRNNWVNTKGFLKKMEPINFKILPTIEDEKNNTIYFAPILGWNRYDQTMFGLALYNHTFPSRNFEWDLLPMYATNTGSLTGLASLAYHLYPESLPVSRISLGLRAKGFHYRFVEEDDYDLKYNRLEPRLEIELPSEEIEHQVQWRSILLWRELAQYNSDNGAYLGNQWSTTQIHELSYELKNLRSLHPYGVRAALEQQSYTSFTGKENYLKASLELKSTYNYTVGKRFYARFFAGGFLQNSRRKAGGIYPGAFKPGQSRPQ